MKGRVKWFDDKRGYGFITSEDGVDTYVHFTAIVTDGYRTLKHNWRVEYDVVTVEDGRAEARNVVVQKLYSSDNIWSFKLFSYLCITY